MSTSAISLDLPPEARDLYTTLQREVEIGADALKHKNPDVAIALFQSALEKLEVGDPFYDHLVHNLLLAYALQIQQLLAAGDGASATRLLGTILGFDLPDDVPTDPEFRARFAGVYQDVGLDFFRQRLFEESTACHRKAIAVEPRPGFYVNLTNSLAMSGQRAELADFMADTTPEQLGRHIFIACVPKTASTFLKNLLVGLTGYRDAFMVHAPGQSEHELYLPILREVARQDTVTQQHCRAADANVQMMQAFAIRPVVLVRNIFDSVMSLLDFYNRGAFLDSYHRADFLSLDDATKVDLLIDNVIPWYFQFVASWDLVERQQRLDIMWLTYEELVADKPAAVQKILAFYGLGVARRNVEEAIRDTEADSRKNRFNKGVTGRGRVSLTDAQKDRIRGFARYFPSTDFFRLGL
jgi:hypothetical protein